MATHSSMLAWEITWTEEPGKLQSTGLKDLDMSVKKTINIRFPMIFFTELEPMILILCRSIHDTEFPNQY